MYRLKANSCCDNLLRSALWSLILALWITPFGARAGEDQGGEIGFMGGAVTGDEDLTGQSTDVGISLGVRGGYVFTPSLAWFVDGLYSEFDSNATQGDVQTVSARAGLEYLFNKDKNWSLFLSFGAGWMNFDRSGPSLTDDDFDRFFGSVGVGQRVFTGRRLQLRWEIRADKTITLRSRSTAQDGLGGRGIGQGQILVGLNWSLKKPDGDGDGVADGIDWCSGTPLGARVDVRGCATDADGDGVADGIDRCADTPKGAWVDVRGCATDADGDGVPDGIDRCGDTPQGALVDDRGCATDADGDGVPDGIDQCADTLQGALVDDRGCATDADGDGVPDGIDPCPGTPEGIPIDDRGCALDADGDGVSDSFDQCAGTPQGARVDDRGCALDADGDGVPDGIDQCPDTQMGTVVDASGCVMAWPGIQAGMETVELEGVYFDSGGTILTPDSMMVLDRVVRSLQDWPTLRVEVAGHTDASGSEGYNMRLSIMRAESVRDYLAGQGIDPGRLVVQGYGESQPIADNSTEEGRAKNRRIELRGLD